MKSPNSKSSNSSKNHKLTNNVSTNIFEVIKEIKRSYLQKVPEHIQILDSFIFSLIVISIIQVIYCILIHTTYPLDSFIGGVFCSIGTALLVSALRVQLTCPSFFGYVPPNTAFIDFVICSIVFFIGCASVLV